MTTQEALPFVGRASDRLVLTEVAERLRTGLSAAVIVSGEAGVGKSRLLAQLTRDAGDLRTVTVTGFETEARLGFAALQRIVAPFLAGLSMLPYPQRDALSTAFGMASGPPPNRFLVGLAAMTVLEQAAGDQGLLCVIDDVQWVDQESVDALAFVARRLDAEGVGLVFGLRGSSSALSALSGIPEHRLGPLSTKDMRSLLLVATPTPPSPAVAVRLIAESEGNPLALLEYVASLSAERLAGTTALPLALPVGQRLSAGFAQQVARLPAVTRRLLVILSAAGPDEIDAALAAWTRSGLPSDALQPALEHSILTAIPRLAFRHPLIRSVIYETATTTARESAHGMLAEVADGQGAADAAAWHRAWATSDPDEDVARELELTAARARESGGYAAEANFLTLAVQRSHVGSAEHSRRLLAAVHAHTLAGNGTQAENLLGLYQLGSGSDVEVETERMRIKQSFAPEYTGLEAATLFAAAARLPTDDLDLARLLLTTAIMSALETRGRTQGTSLRAVSRALLGRPRLSNTEPTALDLINECLAVRCGIGYRAAAPLMRETLLRIRDSDLDNPAAALMTWMVMEDVWDDEFESTAWARTAAWNQAYGAWSSAWIGVGSCAVTEARHGNFDAAQALFDESTGLVVAIGGESEQLWSVLVGFRAWQGREAETRAMADTLIHDWSERRKFGSTANFALAARTVLELGLGNYRAAFADAQTVAGDDPPGHGSQILPDLIEAAIRIGDNATAGLALDELTMRATSAGTPWALGLMARSTALTLTTSSSAQPHYVKAIRILDSTPLRIEAARTHLLYGEWLRRRKRRADAREHLSTALQEFRTIGAAGFAERAANEVAAAGGVSVAVSAKQRPVLTAQEARVADLASRGMTNTEISEQLFISASTVDYHLSKVFRKLEVVSRRRLKAKLHTSTG